MNILTTTLGDKKTVVLAKQTQWGIDAVTYGNLKQANNKIEQLRANGIDCFLYDRGEPAKFIIIK